MVLQWCWESDKCRKQIYKMYSTIYSKIDPQTQTDYPQVHLIASVCTVRTLYFRHLYKFKTPNKAKGGHFCSLLCMPLQKLSKLELQRIRNSKLMYHNRPEQINKLERKALHKRLARNYLSKFLEACCFWPIRMPPSSFLFCREDYLTDASWHHWHIASKKL